MPAEADHRQPETQATGGDGRVIAVYSGKGGVGRTTITVNLASLLASEQHRRVVALDLNLQYGDLATVVPTVEDHPTIVDVVVVPVEELDYDFVATAMINGPGGFKFIAAPYRPELADLVTPEHVSRLVSLLRANADFVLVDCGSHITDAITAVTDTADTILLVTTPTTPSLKSLRLATALFEQLGVPRARIMVVLNHPDEHSDFSDGEVAASLGRSLALSLPHDSRTAVMALDSGEPFVFTRPRSGLAAGLRKLAADLVGDTTAAERRGLTGILSTRGS